MIFFLFIFQVSSSQSIISVGKIKEHKVSRSVHLKILNAESTIKSTVLLYILPFRAMMALSAVQSSVQLFIYNAILFIDTSNNALYYQVHWIIGISYLLIIASNDLVYRQVDLVFSHLMAHGIVPLV